ncbi:MAG TPA: glycosyltransferase [Gammaproteobacteria bacterium]|nr:glycosyltransferase [Gammaproteobacteria bacterium]
MSFRPCAVIPVYNHHLALPRLVAGVRDIGLPVILVDDGSDAVTKAALAVLKDVEVLTQPMNGGKGKAVLAGIAMAAEQGYSHVLQVDADGQHDIGDAPKLLKLAEEHPHHLISGAPIYDESVPKVRFYGRYLTHALVWLSTLSFTLIDSMCGFRVYPVTETLALAKRARIGTRMDFDTDIMVRLYWAGTECLFVPTKVHYPEDGLSNYRMFKDNLRMFWLHLRLDSGMLLRSPGLIRRSLARKRQLHWAHIGERGTLAGLRFIGALDRIFPRWVGHAVLYPVTAYFFLVHGNARRASRRFLKAAGQPATLGQSFRHFFAFSISILDKVAAWYDPKRIPVELGEAERRLFLDAVGQKRGLLLLSGHLGNLELARAIATLIPGITVNALVYTQNSRKLTAMLEETNEAYHLKLIYVQEIDPGTAMSLREKIDAGEVVVIVGDRVPVGHGRSAHHAEDATVQASFLGKPAPFAIGPYVLAHILECPVLLFFCLHQAQGYKIYMEPFAERIHLPRKGRDYAAAGWAARYAERLADYAARFPLQWYNFYDFWDEEASRQGTPR